MDTHADIFLELERERKARLIAEEALAEAQLELDAIKEKEERPGEEKEVVFKINTRELHSMALFAIENPNPILRVALNGDILYQNPAALFMNFYEYEKYKYRQAEFWKFFAQSISPDAERLHVEVRSESITIQFDCHVLKDKGYMDIFGHDISKEKLAEAREKVAERRWKFAIEGQAGGIWEYNLQTTTIEYSPQFRSMLGYDMDEFATDATSYEKLVHPRDAATLYEMMAAYATGKIDSHMVEYRVRSKDQTYRWVMDRGQLVSYTSDGQPEIVMGINTDITKRKEEERILYETEQRWKLALEGSGEGVWEYNHITKEFYISDVGKEVLDLKDHDWQKNGWRAFVHPDDKPLLLKVDRDYLDGKIKFHKTEYRVLQSNGEYRWIQDKGALISKTEDGEPIKFIGLISDITQRKKGEEELRLSEEKYRGIIEGIKLGLLEVDNNDVVIYVSPSFCNMSGYSYEEIIGRRASDLLVGKSVKSMMENDNDLKKAPRLGVYELEVTIKTGEKRWWLISGTPLFDVHHKSIGSLGLYLDATERKSLESNLIDAKKKAEESDKAKDIFMANMSHEIRTPMNAILGLSSLLKKTPLTQQQETYLSSIHTATSNLLEIINDILVFSRIEAGKLFTENIGFNLRSLLFDALNFFAYDTERKGLELIFNCDDNLSKVLIGDPYRINQVLTNLLSNAVKFTQKGSISLDCTVVADENDAQTVLVSVTDTGIGMDEDFKDKLFEKFVQEDKSTTRKYGGSGLGMSIAKQLVILMKGDIAVESKKNSGTTITVQFKLPKGTQEDLPGSELPGVTEINIANAKILLAEDNDMNRLVASTILSQHGVVVDEAANGRLAVEKEGANNYDLVLMDISMPEMDGFEATQRIRKHNKTLPIIALTAHGLPGEAEKCIAAGMNDFLVKPYRENELTGIIVKWLNKHADLKKENVVTNSKQPQQALYDLTQLKQMSSNNKSFILKMLNLFIKTMPVEISKMESALQQYDMPALKNVAHSIKPTIDNMHITTQKNTIRRIEQLAVANGDRQEIKTLLDEFKTCINEVIEAIKLEVPAYE